MAFVKVQDNTAVTNNGGASLVVTFTSALTANNLIVVFWVTDSAEGATPAGYTKIGPATGFCNCTCYYKVAAGGETSVTLAQSVSSGGAAYWAEWSGAATVSPVDVSALGNSLSAAGGTLTGPSVTTTNANDLILAADGDDSSIVFASMGGGFTLDRQASATGTGTLVTAVEGNRIVAATGTYTPTYAQASNPSNNAAITVAFKAATAGGNVSIPGVTAPIVLSARAGAVSVAVPGATATVVLAAPAGSVSVAIPGATAPVTLAAPAGTISVAVPGATATVVLAAPPGSISAISGVSIAGVAATIVLAAPTGTISVTLPGVTATIVLAAPAGFAGPTVTLRDVVLRVGQTVGRWFAGVTVGRWQAGTTASRWQAGETVSAWKVIPQGATMSQTIASASLQYVRAPVAATVNGAAFNPTVDTVQMAFTSTFREPVLADFNAGSWETAGSTYYARCLVGPGGAVALAAGVWFVWVKVTDAPEIPVLPAGTLTVTP